VAKERAKAEKLKKFQEKQAKNAQTQPSTAEPKAKEKKKPDKKKEEAVEEWVDETKPGEKKILKPVEGALRYYNPTIVESSWYDWWEKEGFFKPNYDNHKNGYFVIPIPPPNVTGALHCGHAIANSLQDTLIRYYRMKGLTTLYVPGCDHAGIATQTVVEKQLARREGKTRHDLGRAAFIDKVWEWKGEYHERITRVLKRMGGSFDWSREAFTMSPQLSEAVKEAFVRMHSDGMIYRANRLVGWCATLQSALSNVEIDQKELTGRTKIDVPGYKRKIDFGVITYFKYPIKGSDEYLTVATTRPETMLGDTGIAVSPKDKRYAHLVGKEALHPFVKDRVMHIVADDHVDPEFGTGAVKITPAHDQNDFDIGKRHNLEFVNMLTDSGHINSNGGEFEGQPRFEARYTVVAKLKELGLYVKEEDNPMIIPMCSRTKDVIEPMLKPQWWMKMDDLTKRAREAVENGDITVRPESAKANYFGWLKEPRDWCLSRQLWWGHQIPAYYVKIEGLEGQNDETDEYFVVGRTEEEAQANAEKKFPGKKFTLERDPDVLDTWFSSGLWPMSTLGWPQKTVDFEKLFPTSVLETGYDIMFFWVIRMVFFSLYLTGKVPFSEVYCHALIRDSEGRKMSKSLGNVIDPMDLIQGQTLEKLHASLHAGNLDPKEVASAEKYQKKAFPQGIPQLGTDAMRFSLVQYTVASSDTILLDVKQIKACWSFAQKMYQATIFALQNFEGFTPQEKVNTKGNKALVEKWMLHKTNAAAKAMNNALENREFARSTNIIYSFFYDDVCSIYIENSKQIIGNGTAEEKNSAIETLYTALDYSLRFVHPMMPFVSEELWQRLPRRPNDTTPSICIAKYPEYDPALDDPESEAAYDLVLGIVKSIRGLLTTYDIADGNIYIQPSSKQSEGTTKSELPTIKLLSSLKMKPIASYTILSSSQDLPSGCAFAPVPSVATNSSDVVVALEVKGKLQDVSKAVEKAKKELKEVNERVKAVRMEIEDPGFEKVERERQEARRGQLKGLQGEMGWVERSIEQLEALKLDE